MYYFSELAMINSGLYLDQFQ